MCQVGNVQGGVCLKQATPWTGQIDVLVHSPEVLGTISSLHVLVISCSNSPDLISRSLSGFCRARWQVGLFIESGVLEQETEAPQGGDLETESLINNDVLFFLWFLPVITGLIQLPPVQYWSWQSPNDFNVHYQLYISGYFEFLTWYSVIYKYSFSFYNKRWTPAAHKQFIH